MKKKKEKNRFKLSSIINVIYFYSFFLSASLCHSLLILVLHRINEMKQRSEN